MPKRTIEIDDDLDEREESVRQEIRDDAEEWRKDNPGASYDTYYQKQGCDFVHDAADSNTPIYNNQIDGLWYLYGSEFQEAHENAGFDIPTGDDAWRYKMQAIYCYLSEKGFDELRKIEEEWGNE